MPEQIWYLQQCRLCEQVTPEQLELLENQARVKTFPRNSTIYLPQDLANHVYLLLEGRVRLVSITPEGKQAILALFEPGDLFGELSLVGENRREEFAEAVTKSTIVAIPRATMEQVMQQNAGLTLAITKLIGFRRRRLERRLRNLLFRTNRERLVALLWELVEQYGTPISEGTLIDIRLSHQDLAGLIGVTRESVTLVLGELQSEGLVTVGRQRIVVTSLERLAQAADESIDSLPPHLRPPSTGVPTT
ncbi:MAG: Crp/Fnr family transcriptional regulator [Planctomycetaceae bacterium]|nr:Crp/Fnr family transcriptional regulator [Planctomycetaceae bacterium]